MKYYIILLALFFTVTGVKSQEIEWISIENAVELNKVNPKPFLINVYTDWCGWCKRMGMTTYKNEVIIKYINKNYHAVKLNGEEKKDILFKDYTFTYKPQGRRGYNEFAAALLNGKLSYPTTVFLNDKVEILDRVPGYLDANLMEKVIKYFGMKKYEDTKWEDFVKEFESEIK